MAATFTVKLDKRFVKEARGRIENFDFQVGILEDKLHKNALSKAKGFSTLAGAPTRKVGKKPSSLTIADVSQRLRLETGINFLTVPWSQKKNQDIVKFISAFMRLITVNGGKLTEKKRLENLLQAVVRNPIIRGDYGRNSKVTAKIKGFNRFMIDTGQLFRAIIAKVEAKRV